MAIEKKEIRGSIQGQTVLLNDTPRWPDGQSVIVIPETKPALDEEGRARLLRAAGAWAGDDEEGLEQYLEWNRGQRKATSPEIER